MSWHIQEKYAVAKVTVYHDEDVVPISPSDNLFYLPVFKEIDDGRENYAPGIYEEITKRQESLSSYAERPSGVESRYVGNMLGTSGVYFDMLFPAIGKARANLYVPWITGEVASISYRPSLYDNYIPGCRWFLLEDVDGKYSVWMYESYPTVSMAHFVTPSLANEQVPLFDSHDFVFVKSKNDPIYPEEITDLVVSPSTRYVTPGGIAKFSANYTRVGGTTEEAKDVLWRVRAGGAPTDYAESVDGVSISSTGSVSVSDTTTLTSVDVRAFSLSTPHIGSASLFISEESPAAPSSPGQFIPNPGNQYFPGGVSKPSGVPQGSYDQTFGPDISTLIPGLDSNGRPTGDPSVTPDVSKSGMFTRYLCGEPQLNILAQLFWEDNIGIQAAKLVFGNPIDAVISLIAYPFAVSSLVPTVSQNYFLGQYDSKILGTAITRSSIQIDWGEIEINYYWGNFLDYAPYTQVHLFLPWGTGFVTIDPNEIMPYTDDPSGLTEGLYKRGSIRVVTNIELDKGACVHNVIGNRGLVIGTYGGVAGKQVPMTAVDNSAKMLALIGAATGVGMSAANAMAGAATGKYTNVTPTYTVGSGGLVNSIDYKHSANTNLIKKDLFESRGSKVALASAAALATTPPNYPRAGTFSDATNTLSPQKPYIIISRPSQNVPFDYGKYNGYPSNIYYNKLADASGYSEISEIHLDNVPASVSELRELDSILKDGVLL